MNNGCPCGGIILADTEDWKVPLCNDCFVPLSRLDIPEMVARIEKLQTALAIAMDALDKVGTKFVDGIDEANYPIKVWPTMADVQTLARTARENVQELLDEKLGG